MATVAELVQTAYRRENLIAIGQTVTAAQLAEGVQAFNGIWRSILGSSLGEKLIDWPVPPNPAVNEARDYPLLPRDAKLPSNVWPYPQQNSRLITYLGGAQTVYLKQNPDDGARMGLMNIGPSFAVNPLTINANGRLIEGASTLVLNAATATPLLWFYRADLGNWVRLGTLTATSESPLPEEFDEFWECAVVIDLCPRYGKDPSAVTAKTYRSNMAALTGRYAQTMPAATDPGNLWSMPFQSFALPGWGTQW